MMSVMCGSDQYAELEEKFRAALVNRIRDGLYWDYFDPRRPWRNCYAEKFYGKGKDEDFATIFATGRMIRAMTAWREASGSTAWDEKIRECVAGMRRVAIRRDDY